MRHFLCFLRIPCAVALALAALLSSAISAQMVSVNFYLTQSGDWEEDQESIDGPETFGLVDYDGEGTSTVTGSWNNFLSSESSATSSSAILDSTGGASGISVTVAATMKSWGPFVDQPGRVGVPAWNMSTASNAVQISGLQSFSPAVDVIVYLGYQNNSGFTGGSVTIGTTSVPVAAGQDSVVLRGVQSDTLNLSLSNQTPGGVGSSGMFLGGFQLVAVEAPDPSGKPNVLLIICDDLNTDVSRYGGHPQSDTATPELDSFMDTAHTFLQAHCPSPICAPSRASFLTGIYPHTSRNFGFDRWYDNNTLANSHTIASYFKANGYYTLGAGKMMHHYQASQWDEYREQADYGPYAWDGVTMSEDDPTRPAKLAHPLTPAPYNEDGGIDGSFGPLIPIEGIDFGDGKSYTWRTGAWATDRYMEVNGTDVSQRDLTADEANTIWAIERLNDFAVALPQGKPFFMGVGYLRPHTPLIVDQKYFDRFPIESVQLPVILDGDVADTFGSSDTGSRLYNNLLASYGGDKATALKHFVQAYLACVASVDESIGQILDTLDAHPSLRDNTIIVVTSDHGWHNGEKDLLHKNTLWEISTRVPFIVRAPDVTTPGAVTTHPISQIHLFPTLQDLCDLTTPTKKSSAGADLDGFSLRPFFEVPGRTEWNGPSSALTARYRWGVTDKEGISYTLRDSEWRYIRYHTGEEELYHNATDPYEHTNLAHLPEQAARMRAFERELKERVGFLPRTDLSGQILFWQDFEEDDAGSDLVGTYLSATDPMGFSDPIQTDANATVGKGDMLVEHFGGSNWLSSVAVDGRESVQFRLDVFRDEPIWTMEFDLSISDVSKNHEIWFVFYGGSNDELTIETTGVDNVVYTPGGGTPVTSTFTFAANSTHHVELSYASEALTLTIDEEVVFAGAAVNSNRNNIAFMVRNTGSNPAPTLSFDNILVVRNQSGALTWLANNGFSPDTDLSTLVNGRSMLEEYATNGSPMMPLTGTGDSYALEYYGNADGVTYDVEYSLDLVEWDYLPPEHFSPMDAEGMIRIEYPSDEIPAAFFRLALGLE
jgi:arylsulfatase A-like enzyme